MLLKELSSDIFIGLYEFLNVIHSQSVLFVPNVYRFSCIVCCHSLLFLFLKLLKNQLPQLC